MSRKSFSSLLVNSFCCQVPARCSSWGGRRAGENKQKLSPRPAVGTIMATLPLGRGAVPTPLGHRLLQLCEVRGKLWKTFSSFSGSFFTSCRWLCGIKKKKGRGVAETGKPQPTSQDEWTAGTLGGRPTDSLWGESSLLAVSWRSPSKLLRRLVCTAPGPGYALHSD